MYNKKSHIHFVGIGGIGMSGIATILKQQGYFISGCDLDICQQSIYNLRALGCTVHAGNNTEGCRDRTIDILVYSSAVREDSPELLAAQARGIPTIPRALMLAELMRSKYSIAVAGAHGKTTTTSFISHILMEAKLDPTVIIGGHLASISNNARMGSGNFLVAEADESDRSFLSLNATFSVVTNIDREHLETYRDLDDIKSSFKKFLCSVPFYGKAIVCLDDPNIRSILPLEHVKVIKYGIDTWRAADMWACDVSCGPTSSTCLVCRDGINAPLGPMLVTMPGRHNVLNALAAVSLALELGVSFEVITSAMASFKGVDRRFTYRGMCRGAEVFDDYGHHPREIEVTLAAARKRAKNKLIVVFQPHRYTRTDKLWNDFITTFLAGPVDRLIITDIYPANEHPIPGVTAENLVEALNVHKVPFAVAYHEVSRLKKVIEDSVGQGDLVLCIGAGKQVSTLSKDLAHDTEQPCRMFF